MFVVCKRAPEGRVVTMRITSIDPTGSDFLTLMEELSRQGGTMRVELSNGKVYTVDYPPCLERLQ